MRHGSIVQRCLIAGSCPPGPVLMNNLALPVLRALNACSLTKDWCFHLSLLELRVGLPAGWFPPQTLSGLGQLLVGYC